MVKPIDLTNRDAMNAPIKRPLCSDAKPMTPLRILRIAETAGEFRVSWRYRDEALSRAARRLAAAKALHCISRGPGESVYVLHRDFDRNLLHVQ